tara:strand:- start:422 stop:640 length:219 start_codon:yes stop_codon:yes gene_type:complete
MKITKNFGNRTHVSFIVNTKHKGVGMYVFVEATVDKKGIKDLYLRENGKNEALNPDHLDRNALEELIIKQLY